MLPYQAVAAMDYPGYQRQSGQGISGGPMGMGAALGMTVGGPSFPHSWFVPTQDLCAVPYKQMPSQHQNTTMHSNQQLIEPGILELRKEKSRDAARSRRGKENYEFYELAKMLPLPAAITSQLDKASIIRLTISYLKLRDFSGHGDPPWSRENNSGCKILKGPPSRRTPAGVALDIFEEHQGTHILQSLDGFALAVAADGRFLYISETVSIYLGLSQVEMTGSSVFDYIHQGDHAEMAEHLGLSLTSAQNNPHGGLASPSSGGSDEGGSSQGTNNPDVSQIMSLTSTSVYKGFDRAFCVRMKSTLTKRGCHFKSSGYRVSEEKTVYSSSSGKISKTSTSHYSVVLMLCRLRPQYTFSHTRKSQPPLLGMVALAIALPPPSVHEIRLEPDMFVTRINFNFTIAHCEPKVSDLLDYTPEELVGKNLYNLCHGEDSNKLRKCHLDLLNKGQVLTHYYRIMNKNGGFTWLQTCATVICNSKNAEEQNIICVNYVISAKEYENLILDCCQLENGLEMIKREEPTGNGSGGGGDNGAGSPGSDPSNNDNNGGSSGSRNIDNKPPKPETPEPRRRIRSDNSHNTANLANPSNSSLSIDINHHQQHHTQQHIHHHQLDEAIGITSPTPITPTPIIPITTTASRRGQKRKLKQQQQQQQQQQLEPIVDESASQVIIPNSTDLTHHHSHHNTIDENHAGANSESSVKDLENAMSKHLPSTSPSISNNNNNNSNSNPNSSGVTTDFSTDSLLKQQQQQQQQQALDKNSTIQWIGHHHNHHPFHHQQTSPMPATALLRQLYANRESVIRATTTRPSAGGVFYPDASQTGPLPTPPGSESSFDNQFLLHGHTGQKPPTDAFSNLVSSYGGYPTTMDYHNAMTPPSSVSPRDNNGNTNHANKTSTPSTTNGGFEYTTDVLRNQYSSPDHSNNTTPSLPLKPQPYSAAAAAAMHHAAAVAGTPGGESYGGLDQTSQYFSHHSGFHLYHKGTPPSAGWYTTPS